MYRSTQNRCISSIDTSAVMQYENVYFYFCSLQFDQSFTIIIWMSFLVPSKKEHHTVNFQYLRIISLLHVDSIDES